jgi:Flp pilus assembly protein TadD
MFSAFFDAFPDHGQAAKTDSAYASAYSRGGTCAAIEGHLDSAASLLQLAVSFQPQDSQSWNNLANVYRSMGMMQKALDA